MNIKHYDIYDRKGYFALSYSLRCFGSTATLTIGLAAKFMSVKAGQASVLETVPDLYTMSSKPPIPVFFLYGSMKN